MAIKKNIVLLAFLLSLRVCAQDTLSVYFEFGSSKIPEDQHELLNSIPVDYALSELDSIYFIGAADSVGNYISNLELSEKRARTVAQYCIRLIPSNTHSKILALGEKSERDPDENRRVDIVLYFNKEIADTSERIDAATTIDACYYTSYPLLHNANIRMVMYRGKEKVIVEVPTDFRIREIYYQGSLNKSNEFLAKELKWKTKKTGNLWWAKDRQVVMIPKGDFDRFRIFQIDTPPCNECDEAFQIESRITLRDECEQVDRFLMKNIQIKPIFLNRNQVNIRAPREFVNLIDKYYVGCDFKHELQWETKKGKRKKRYYYSRLPLMGSEYLYNIMRVMECCTEKPEPSECDRGIVYCGFRPEKSHAFTLTAEAGTLYQKLEIIPYGAIGFNLAEEFGQGFLSVGTDIDLDFYASLRIQYEFFDFPVDVLLPAQMWSSPEGRRVYKYGTAYLGSEIKTKFSREGLTTMGQNIHLGIARFNTMRYAAIPRMFVHLGVAVDYMGSNSLKPYPFVQVGVNVKIATLRIKT